MTSIERMKLVDDITCEISEKIGVLSRQGIFTFEEGVDIIKRLNDRHVNWIKTNFSQDEYREFLASKTW